MEPTIPADFCGVIPLPSSLVSVPYTTCTVGDFLRATENRVSNPGDK